MAVDIFIKIGDIKGESQDNVHKGEIDVLSWKWGATNGGTTHLGSGGGSGKVHVHDIAITKWVDLATPSLMLACCNGKHYSDATLTIRKAGENPLEYLVIKLHNVILNAWSTGGAADATDRMSEHISLNFAKFTIDYKEQNPDGKAGLSSEIGWDIAANIAKAA